MKQFLCYEKTGNRFLKKLGISIFFLFFTLGLKAQCPAGNVSLTSQAAVNNFATNYPNCSEISGYLYISGSTITDLSPLSNLTSVGGYLRIYNNSNLTNLDGLSNLTSIGGHLGIYSNSNLTNLDGLSNLTSVGGYLGIYNNSNLTNLDGLSNLTSVGGYLYISSNSSLTNLDGLSNLTSVGGYLYIGSNSNLTNLDGLSNLTSVGGYLHIRSNSSLTNLDGLSNLTSVGGDLDIYNNSNLINLDGLSNLTSIGGYLVIESNSSLTDISGLQNIDPASILSTLFVGLHIAGNTSLSVCNLENFCTYLAGSGLRTISGNAGYCISEAAVTTACISACDAPTNLTATNITSVSATLGWTSDGNNFDIEWGTQGFTQGSGTLVTDITTNSYNLTNLDYNTQYQFYIRQDCTVKESDWAGPFSFTTLPQCPPGNVSLTSQAQINAFATNYPNCTEVSGNLTIQGANNLTPLSNLTSVGGNLNISYNSSLTNLDGLSNLTSVGGDLRIDSNSNLDNLDGLSNLTSVGGYLNIYGNSNLTNLDGLSNLTSVGGYLRIRSNSSLTNLDGLSNLTSVGADLVIQSNSSLTDISGLQNIDPASILSTNGLDLGLYIVNNTSLSVCNLPNFCTYLQGSGLRTISGNAGYCISEAAVTTACISACDAPTNLTATNITSVSATLGWTSDGNNFDIEWGTQGFTQGSGTLVTDIATNSYNLTNLDYNTQYQFYIRQDCTVKESDWAGPFSFTTLPQCPAGNVSLTSQADVNNFATDYPNCTEVSGNLKIQGANNLTPLSNLTSIGGHLEIYNNSSLINLDGLSNLTSVGGFLFIGFNSNLTDLDGLSNLTSVGGYLTISSNSSLTNLDGLSNLTSVGGYLEIYNNLSLTNLDGLSNLTSVGGHLHIRSNSSLNNLDGLSNLTSVGGYLRIYNNSNLTDLDGLSNLTSIGGYLVIESNSSLTDISGLQNIDPASILSTNGLGLYIMNNSSLSVCNLENFCTYLAGSGLRTISDNAGDCISEAAVTTACIPCDAPTNLTATNITSVSATLGWTSDGNNFDIEWGTQGFTQGSGTLVTDIATNSYNLTNLDYNTQYQFYIRQDCTVNESNWAGPFSFTTLPQCPPGDVILNSQTEVDDFATNYPNCTEISGGLNISGGSTITDLSPLSNLTSVGGYLNIGSNSNLTNLDGLSNLTSVGGNLFISANSSLTNLDGLSNLTSVGVNLYIVSNSNLTSLDGLSNLTSVGGSLTINSNSSLTNLDGLNNLTSIGGGLYIDSNPNLTNLDGLSNLTSVGGYLYIQSNSSLTDISGLQNIDPASILPAIGVGLYIVDNTSLSVCNLPNFCTYLQGSGPRNISGNAGDCISEAAVTIACIPCDAPTNLTATNITSVSATLGWTSDGNNFDIEWGTQGFTQGSGTLVTDIATNSYNLTNLDYNTQYQFYIRQDCTVKESDWAGPFSFTTLPQCPTGDVYLTSQALINSFATNYPNCTEISGDLQISGSDITDLSPLSNLTSVGGFLEIISNSNSNLTNLYGLNNLTSVGGYLYIRFNSITDLEGLSNLTSIGGGLYIDSNPNLTNLDGLSNLTSVGGYLEISSNSSLTDLDGLSNLTSVGGYLRISNNSNLTDLDGLSNLTSIGGGLYIDSNPNLTNLDGLSNLTSVGGLLRINFNSNLTNLDGLSNLTSVGGYLSIYNNSYLTNLDGLSNLTSVGGYLSIYNNSYLTNLDGLSNLTSVGGYLRIYNNSNLTDLDGLSNLTSIGGYLVIESNSSLTDISGLQNIDPASILSTNGFGLYIVGNTSLSVCNLENFCTYLAGSGLRTISGNAEYCISEAAVTTACISACDAPTNLTATNITSVSATLGWTSDGNNFDIEWGTQGFTQGSGTLVTDIATNSYNLTNLDYNTQYQFYIRQDCTVKESDWAGPFSFTTLPQCPAGDVILLDSQTEVDDFATNHPNCTEISGDLYIYGNDITDLSPLSNLTSVGGNLYIFSNSSLLNLDGLNNLTSVGGVLDISFNSNLTNLNGLSNLTSVGGYLNIYDNLSLTNLDGLSNLTSLGGYLSISFNSSLNNLDGLSNLTSIGGYLRIYNNSNLTDISGLQNIDPASILSTNGFGLYIVGNTSLSVCNLENFCTYLAGSGLRTISGNAGYCISEAAVTTACISACDAPTNLTATNITSVSATLGWTSDGNNFDIEWGTQGFTQGSGTLVTDIATNSYNLTNLDYNTQYQFYIRQDCTVKESDWAGPFSFTTLLANDNIEGAIPVECGGTYTGSTATATNDQPNPAIFGVAATLSPNVWYSYTGSGEPELITASLCNSEFDTAILIATGTPGDLTWVAGNDDAGINGPCGSNTTRSYVQFNSDGVTTYYIMVRGYDVTSTGTYELVITCQEACSPATTNDEVADAEIVILGTPLATNNTCATASPQSYPTCGSQYATYYDTWYTFNSGNSSNINITITPEPGVTVGFAIYSGDEDNLSQISCNTSGTSTNLNVAQNTNYYVRAFSISPTAKGDFTLSVSSNCEAGVWTGATSTAWNTANNWCGGVVPDSTTDVVIASGSVNYPVISGDVEVASITVEDGASVTVNGSLTTGDITVANGGNFVVSNGASLMQSAMAVNTGNITVQKNSNPMFRLDYTLWSSPVAGMRLVDFSSVSPTSPAAGNGTLWNRVYTLGEAAWEQVWNSQPDFENDTLTFTAAKGYLYRAPNDWVVRNGENEPLAYEGAFTGVPNNGTISVDTPYEFSSIGNPYPSPINADLFISENIGTLYFWTNTNPPENNTYDGINNWVYYNLAGKTGVDGVHEVVNDMPIQPGQGFVIMTEQPTVVFNNSMRTSNNGDFYKMMSNEKHRFWLNLSNEEVVFNQILVGYMDNATQGVDTGIDAEMFAYEGNALYSIIENSDENYVIQGRSLPFTASDVVALGFRAVNAGSFTISLANLDGLFADNQNIYLKDNFTQSLHNLKEGAYTFVSEEGIFNTRFEVVYQTTMSVENPIANNANWIVYSQENGYQIQTQGFELKSVQVFDLLGRAIYTASAEGTAHHIPSLGADSVYIVKVTTTDNVVLSKKVR